MFQCYVYVRMPLDEERVKYWIPKKMSETFTLQNGGIILAWKPWWTLWKEQLKYEFYRESRKWDFVIIIMLMVTMMYEVFCVAKKYLVDQKRRERGKIVKLPLILILLSLTLSWPMGMVIKRAELNSTKFFFWSRLLNTLDPLCLLQCFFKCEMKLVKW